jgi:sulfur relay (sulfurtransferase) DsrC/TusE family protein
MDLHNSIDQTRRSFLSEGTGVLALGTLGASALILSTDAQAGDYYELSTVFYATVFFDAPDDSRYKLVHYRDGNADERISLVAFNNKIVHASRKHYDSVSKQWLVTYYPSALVRTVPTGPSKKTYRISLPAPKSRHLMSDYAVDLDTDQVRDIWPSFNLSPSARTIASGDSEKDAGTSNSSKIWYKWVEYDSPDLTSSHTKILVRKNADYAYMVDFETRSKERNTFFTDRDLYLKDHKKWKKADSSAIAFGVGSAITVFFAGVGIGLAGFATGGLALAGAATCFLYASANTITFGMNASNLNGDFHYDMNKTLTDVAAMPGLQTVKFT